MWADTWEEGPGGEYDSYSRGKKREEADKEV